MSTILDAHYARLAAMRSLDSFIRCAVSGCAWRVHPTEPGEVRCADHGGPWRPQFLEDDDGGILAARAFVVDTHDD